METESRVLDINKELTEEIHDSLCGKTHSMQVVEAAKVYILMPKGIPVSRAARLQWLLDHLNGVATIPSFSTSYISNDLEVISAIPHEESNVTTNKFSITNNTQVEFLAQSYRFVYCLDMSPSQTAVDIHLDEILFDEIINNFKTSLLGLCEQFTIPGSPQVFQPCIYLTVIVNTPFFISPAQQVLVKGVQVSSQNVQDVIYSVQTQFHYIEGRIAHMLSLAFDQIDLQTRESDGLVASLFDITETERISNIPVVSSDTNFVNMLRYSMLAISLLPENSLSHIIIITDGVVAMPDSNIMESLLFQLHYDSISLSFLKVGSSFNPHISAGYVSYSDLLHFLSHSTLGTCLEDMPEKINSLSFNVYHELYLFWTFTSRTRCNLQTTPQKLNLPRQNYYGNGVPPLLSKKQTEDDVNISFILLLSRRMREGYAVNRISLSNGMLEVRLSLHWKTYIYIHYVLSAQWPLVKNMTHYEIHITAPYDFLHDITCLMKKETKSSYRQAVFERFWLRLAQLASNDIVFAQQLSSFNSSNIWYTLPESVRSGIPLFILNENTSYDSTKLMLSVSDKSCPKFSSMWQPICQIETTHWRKWFHVHKVSLILKHDHPLPKYVHLANSSGRFQIIQCRQAVTALYDLLSRWSSFILIDNHSYLKLLGREHDKPPLYCIIRVTSKFPSVTLNIGFVTGTSGYLRYKILEELKQELSSLSYLSTPVKSKESICCTLLQKPLEKICIRYERMPSDFYTVIFPDGTQPPHSLQSLSISPFAGTLFTTLSRYLFHQRWIWSANYPSNPRLGFTAISRILGTITRMRLKEGFCFAHSSSGIITMVLEFPMDPALSCVVQYVLFPPHSAVSVESDVYSGSEDEQESDTETELQIVTEVWIEPQFGTVSSNQEQCLHYMENKHYYELSEEIRQSDLNCINSLLTLEHLSLMCQNKSKDTISEGTLVPIAKGRKISTSKYRSTLVDSSSTDDDTRSVWIPILVQRIQHISFEFKPISILSICQQTELLFSMFTSDNVKYRDDIEKSNKLLLENIHSDLLSLHDRELEITVQDCTQFMEQIHLRHTNNCSHTCPMSTFKCKKSNVVLQWRCFLKGVSVTHVILTFIPATLQDIQNLYLLTSASENINQRDIKRSVSSEDSSTSGDLPIYPRNSIFLPMYVCDCPLAMLVESYINVQETSGSFSLDVFEDHRFKLRFSDEEDQISLKTESNKCEYRHNAPETAEQRCSASQHCKTLVFTHSKCFATSLYSALHRELYVHTSDVQSAMDQCEETVYEVDISEYLQTVCGHLKQQEGEIQTWSLNQPKPCNDLRPIHRLIKEKFFHITSVAFSPIPTNKEFYYCRNVDFEKSDTKGSDSDDETSDNHSEFVDFKSESDVSGYAHLRNQSVSSVKQMCPLFLHYICTIRYDGHITNMSVKVLPTCLGELMHGFDTEIEFLDKSKLQITLDVLCLTLPVDVQNFVNGYSSKNLRSTSFSSDGFQHQLSTGSSNSEMSYNSSCNLDFKENELLLHIPISQRSAITTLRDEIKWLLKDEIATSLLDIEPVSISTLKFAAKHVSESIPRTSCLLEVIDLNFVYGSNQSYDKFVQEFCKISVPNYKLCKENDLYYLAKKCEAKNKQGSSSSFQSSKTSRDLSLSSSQTRETGDCKSEPNKSNASKCTNKSEMDESDVSSSDGSVLGTDGGYDEDISQDDDEDYNWLIDLGNKRQNLPNFWLIMQVDYDVVTVYFHCRFLELPTTEVGVYLEVQRSICDAIRGLCKCVNQYLLLQSLHDTRVCDFLLETDDNFSDWEADTSTPTVKSTFTRLKSMDETSDEVEPYPEELIKASLKFKPGYFSCPVVWETHFVLHSRLKTGPGKSGLSIGILALKTVLDKFSVSNRSNMFVYQDANLNVFYLRLHENLNYSYTKNSQIKSNEFENVTRSPSVASLPLGHHKSNLPNSDNSSLSNNLDVRPRVRSFGEKESKDDPQEDTIILKVHGITDAGQQVKCELVQVLQNRLDDAVLDFLSVMLARNAMCPLTPEDVRFLQKPFRLPELVIKLSIQDYAIKLLDSFIYYLRQNVLQFLNIPKYTDNRPHYHFKDYTECEQTCNKVTDDNIFIFNQSQSPSSGNRGISCITLAVIDHSKDTSACNINFEDIFQKDYHEIVVSNILQPQDVIPDIYLEFRLWNQGRVNTENLCHKLCTAASQASWDILTEYYLMLAPLCVSRNSIKLKHHKSTHSYVSFGLQSDENIQGYKNIMLDPSLQSSNITPRIINYELKFDNLPVSPINKKRLTNLTSQKHLVSDNFNIDLKKNINPKPLVRLESLELGDEGILSDIYAETLPDWLEFAVNLCVPAVKKNKVFLSNQHSLDITVRELKLFISQLSQDSVKTFTPDVIDTLHVPCEPTIVSSKCILIARDFEQWKVCTDINRFTEYLELLNSHALKHVQKFVPFVERGGKFIPRQKFLWSVVNSNDLILYTYNWSKDNIDKLIDQCTNLGQWLSVRGSLLSSVTAQKLGLFHDQVISRKALVTSNNPYLSSTGDVDSMLKFPKDRSRRNIASGNSGLPITLLESFKETYRIISPHVDPVVTNMLEMYEIKRSDRKHRDDLKKLHAMYQSRSSTATFPQLQILMQNSRNIHYCHTPLLFLPRWRLQAAKTRDHTIITPTENDSDLSNAQSYETDEFWHTQLCLNFISEYKSYLQTLGFMSLQIDYGNKKHGGVKKDSAIDNVNCMQKALLGGILVFTIELKEPFFITKLHAIEYNRLQTNNARAAINQFMQSFLDECDRVKIFMHLHSFTYDFHLRCVCNYISNNSGSKLKDGYYLTHFLDDFMKYYNKAPNYARNLVYTDIVKIANLLTQGKELYNYLLSNIKQYNFSVIGMSENNISDEMEYVLVQVSNTPQVFYKDAQDRQHADDFDVTVIVTNVSPESKSTENLLHLKYYLIVSSRREIYPKYDVERKLGKFRTVSSMGKSSTSGEAKEPKEIKLSLWTNENVDDEKVAEDETPDVSNEDIRDAETVDDTKPPVVRSHVEIKQELVNYVGYYSSHEQLMQQLILDCAASTQKKLSEMVAQGTVHCRTHLLWNKLLSAQDSKQLTYTEFTELKALAKLENLCDAHPNLGLLLNQPLNWYQDLAKLLLNKYCDQHRLYVSPDGNIQYYVILHPRYVGAFMMLSMDLHTSRGDLYAVYRASRQFEDSDICIRDRKALIDGFINYVCFYLWMDMI